MFRALKTYDLCFRAREGLPLPPRKLTNLLILSALARTQRDDKVELSHYVWMSNHPHMIAYGMDAYALTGFYGELQKRLTDSLKRLLGLQHLNLWEDRATVAEVLDLESAMERIIYTYLNPVRAKLCDTIDNYEGLNTWKEFLKAPADLHAGVTVDVPWIRMPSIKPIAHDNPSAKQEERVIIDLKDGNKKNMQRLTIYPFAWLKPFGISDPIQIEEIRQRIIIRVRQEEARLNVPPKTKVLEGFKVRGYKPKSKERKVFFFSSYKELRLNFLSTFNKFRQQCKECYLMLKQGHRNVLWPPGGFSPPRPILYNALC